MMNRNQISAFLALSVLYWMGLLALRGMALTWDMLVPFGTVVGAVSMTLVVFDAWAWKLPFFRGWLIKRPNLNGTWKTELQSNWIDPGTGNTIPPIGCYTVIRQTASLLSIRLVTAESRSESVSAGIEVCPDGTFEVNCSYRNKPKALYRSRSEVHYGAMILAAESANPSRLDGEYWTDRKTSGSLVLTDRKSKVVLTFEEAQALFKEPEPALIVPD